MKLRFRYLVCAIGAGLGFTLWAVQSKLITLTLEGKTITKSGRMIDGKLFIPADDAAKAFGHRLEHKAGNATGRFVVAGGANPEQGVVGLVGEWLFNGITRLMVLEKVETEAGSTVYTLEVRNAEKTAKTYKFGFTEAQILIFNTDGEQVTGTLMEMNKDYAVDVKPATPYRVRVGFKLPDGFEPNRAVIRIPTQVQGKPQRIELFRVNLNVKA